MLFQIKPDVRALILDMDGVLWRDNTPIGNLPKIFEIITKHQIRVTFATNNSTKNVEQYLEKLHQMGIPASPEQIVNSTMAVTNLLRKRFPNGGKVYIIGEDGLYRSLAEYNFLPTDNDPQAVVVGLDRKLTYKQLAKATIFIRNGVPFYGTNPDKTYPTPEGLHPGAGSILAAIEASTDQKPIIAGKPLPAMMEMAMERMNTSKSETLVVGDRLETDIVGGYNAGCRTCLVLSGVTTRDQIKSSDVKPDYIVDDLSELVGIAKE